MRHYVLCQKTGGLLVLTDLKSINCQSLLECSALYKILLNVGKNVKVYIDNKVTEFKTGQILFCKPLNNVEIVNKNHKVKILAFNKDFYPFYDEEDETSFYWFWFFGAKHPESIVLNESEQRYMEALYRMTEDRFMLKSIEDVEGHKLMIKRIVTVVSLKIQNSANRQVLSRLQLETVKRFNSLIEAHFKKKNKLSDYMEFLQRPPSKLTRLIRQFLFEPHSATNRKKFILELKKSLSLNSKIAVEENEEIDNLEYYYSNAFSRPENMRHET